MPKNKKNKQQQAAPRQNPQERQTQCPPNCNGNHPGACSNKNQQNRHK